MVRNKLQITREFKWDPEYIDNLQYWEYEEMCEVINEILADEKKRSEEQQNEQQSSMPNLNNFASSFKMPKMTMPKF